MTIFYVEDGKVRLDETCYLIPELKAIIDFYEDPIPALSYVHFLTAPESPYHNLSDEDKKQMISDDVGGDFGFEDEVIEKALIKLRKLYDTPLQQLYDGGKNSLQVIGKYLANLTEESIQHGRDGNLSQIFSMQKEMGKVAEQFIKIERLWKEQVQQKLRGNAELGEY